MMYALHRTDCTHFNLGQCLFDWLPQHGGDLSIVSARLSSDKVMLRNSHNEIQMLAGTQLVALGRQKHLFEITRRRNAGANLEQAL